MTHRWLCAALAAGALQFAPRALAQPAPRAAAAPGGQMRDVMISLSPAGRQVFIGEWLKVERVDGPGRKARLSAAQDRAFATLIAEPFNAEALRKAYADQRNTALGNQRARQDRIVSLLAHLSADDRRLVVRQLRAMRERQAAS